MREITFKLDMDIPRSKADAWNVKFKLRALDLGIWGKDMQFVGLGFHWTTETTLADMGQGPLLLLQRRLWRWMRREGIIAEAAGAMLLKSRFTYIRVGEPTGIITLREE